MIACFGAYWSLSLGLTWFVPFLIKGLGFSQGVAGSMSVLPWLVGAITVLSGGAISQALVARGVRTKLARAVVGTLPMVIGGCITLTMPLFGGGWQEVMVLMIGTGLTGPIYVVCSPMLGEFVPAYHVHHDNGLGGVVLPPGPPPAGPGGRTGRAEGVLPVTGPRRLSSVSSGRS